MTEGHTPGSAGHTGNSGRTQVTSTPIPGTTVSEAMNEYARHGVDPASNPVDAGTRATGERLPDQFADPEARAAYAMQQQQTLQAQAQAVDPSQIKPFVPVTGAGTLVYIRHNRAGKTHIARAAGGDVEIPGRLDYNGGQPPYLVVEAEQINRTPEMKRLFRKKSKTHANRNILEVIDEETYYEEVSEWQAWATQKAEEYVRKSGPRGTQDADVDSFRDRINWNTRVQTGLTY